jgi:hypothetical protein
MCLSFLFIWIVLVQHLLKMVTAMFAAPPNRLCAMGVCDTVACAPIPALS